MNALLLNLSVGAATTFAFLAVVCLIVRLWFEFFGDPQPERIVEKRNTRIENSAVWAIALSVMFALLALAQFAMAKL